MDEDYEYVIGEDLKNLINDNKVSLEDLKKEMEWAEEKIYVFLKPVHRSKLQEFIASIMGSKCYWEYEDDEIAAITKQVYKFIAEYYNANLIEDVNTRTKLITVKMNPDTMDIIGTLKDYDDIKIILHNINAI